MYFTLYFLYVYFSILFFICFFFFSSRRRHTRWTGDWSSDVCSSDLQAIDDGNAIVRGHHHRKDLGDRTVLITSAGKRIATRSEERRVGKECRSRWSTYQ